MVKNFWLVFVIRIVRFWSLKFRKFLDMRKNVAT